MGRTRRSCSWAFLTLNSRGNENTNGYYKREEETLKEGSRREQLNTQDMRANGEDLEGKRANKKGQEGWESAVERGE